ncbi:MAG TPA: hypothetical protein VLB05_15215 [Dongiaceae bacterium]|nr:hypothetical protein [Dongiaceae bacterium]
MSVRKPASKSGGRRRKGSKMGAPAGGPADPADLRVLARHAALAALKRLSALSHSEDERVALAATQELLNRAFGKISASGTDEVTAARPLVVRIVKFGEIDTTEGGGRP